jgi:hypothetical protein
MRKIIFTRPDGGTSIVNPVINVREAITEAEAEQRAFAKLPPGAINPQFVDASAIPQDRTFRNAWKQNGTAVEHDMPKCRELHRDRLRMIRKPLLEGLDAQYLRADETGDLVEKARIAVKKQALRDVTADPGIDSAATPEALKAIMPAALK